MKKVININFQGRVIPIEETALDILKQYIDSLRRYFAKEEGRDEIINDIEGRIGELFSEKLKAGSNCVTDDDVNSIILNMGRPEDFEAQDGETAEQSAAQPAGTSQSYQRQHNPRGSLYRNADDKIIGGVSSGLANYLGIDPIIPRIVFVLFFGVLVWVYILLWIIVPSKSLQSNITKRIFRSPDQRVLGGVAGGIATYFNIAVWIPRLIFAAPFIIALISGSVDTLFNGWHFGWLPSIISGSFGWTMFLTYVILWIAVPVASTATDKLEMRGEKVDFNSIANTVKEDLEQVKVKAQKWGTEVGESAQKFSQQAATQAKTFTTQAAPVVRRTGSGLGHAIVVIIKAFLIFIFAIVALALFGSFMGILFGGAAFSPFLGFIFENSFQTSLAWLTLFLFFLIPLIALITWGIRRIMGVRSKKHLLGYAFGGLWVLGLLCGIATCFSVARNFKRNVVLPEEQLNIEQPVQKLVIDADPADWKRHNAQVFGMDVDGDFPFHFKGDDSLMINTVKIAMVKSKDSSFHVYRMRGSRGRDREIAGQTAEKINFEPVQTDSTLTFPRGFYISKKDKFRNQRVWLVIEVPVGKRIEFGNSISEYDWINIRMGDWDDDRYDEWNNQDGLHWPSPGAEYIMQENGPERVNNVDGNVSEVTI